MLNAIARWAYDCDGLKASGVRTVTHQDGSGGYGVTDSGLDLGVGHVQRASARGRGENAVDPQPPMGNRASYRVGVYASCCRCCVA
jgi:hypothetical protein